PLPRNGALVARLVDRLHLRRARLLATCRSLRRVRVRAPTERVLSRASRLLRRTDRLDAHARDVLLLARALVASLARRARHHVRPLSRDEAQRVDAPADLLRALDVRRGQRARATSPR